VGGFPDLSVTGVVLAQKVGHQKLEMVRYAPLTHPTRLQDYLGFFQKLFTIPI
jgi:hypothetical protein